MYTVFPISHLPFPIQDAFFSIQLRSAQTVALACPNVIPATDDFEPDTMPRAVAQVARHRIRHEILVAQIFENLLEDASELVGVFREERASAADGREPPHQLLELRRVNGAPLADGVDGRIAALGSRDRRVERRMTRLIVAVGEEHDRSASRLPSEQVHRSDDDVVKRGASPWREPLDGLCPRRWIGGPSRQREDVVVESQDSRLVSGLQAARNAFAACFTCGMASCMLVLTSIAATSSSGMFSAAKLMMRCGRSSSNTRKSLSVSPRINRSPSVTTAVT
jgi:hypothetical protein